MKAQGLVFILRKFRNLNLRPSGDGMAVDALLAERAKGIFGTRVVTPAESLLKFGPGAGLPGGEKRAEINGGALGSASPGLGLDGL